MAPSCSPGRDESRVEPSLSPANEEATDIGRRVSRRGDVARGGAGCPNLLQRPGSRRSTEPFSPEGSRGGPGAARWCGRMGAVRVRVRGVGAGAAGLGCAERAGNRRQEGGRGPRPGPGVRHRGGLGGVAHSTGTGWRRIGGIMRKRPGVQRRWNPPMCRGARSAHGSPSTGNRRSSKNPGIARKSPNRPAREAPSNVQHPRTGREEPEC